MATLDGLPPLRDVIQRFDLAAKKSLGQNFLFDLNLTQKIARSAGSLEGVTVFEVGPGPGGLTRSILALGAKKVVAVERDSRCLPALAEVENYYPGRLEVIEGDALQTDFAALAAEKGEGGPVKIIANLPYNVGTQLLVNWLVPNDWPPFWQSLTLMFQKEVGQRIVARENDNHYGRLGVLSGWRADSHMVFDVPASAFSPPPKVTSTVVHLTPKAQPLPCDLAKLERVTLAAFGQRRKMLRQSVKSLGGEALLAKADIDPQRRAETLSVEEFVVLANNL
ncbi:16S rRNA (adenine(1518)-N(6)/adenine(1519)-N(6))-dimethyltransferase RsmA [Rhizobiales bacterium RZME27]|uniref:Ribosomal RNA small subunit methyltransferase A n=1 Tax=Endobacterium cereale TaxID=2663029 RepID=A0A6A8ACB3_9HYPH|nr:16S rRNA (adenine(1518)-N(6)/adenine(1519)-N(6))-dimethyltransferase RsmA [Endobacterium cereale]MEB2846168.1 16S rRNA (adenine(1518)-N(6)/adenine(1519)-N(6))-dimethyltransferase RsmA [Endobacterium cereale]MQY48379.1 16S rRNA (adenine(1518)-N(6)/adenine(1519)-N(6))-dimethyltransferase RsmA [Endobacterium cereale]